MSWSEMNNEERDAFLIRAKHRGIGAEESVLSSKEDLIVPARHTIKLGREKEDSSINPRVIQVKSLEQLIALTGPGYKAQNVGNKTVRSINDNIFFKQMGREYERKVRRSDPIVVGGAEALMFQVAVDALQRGTLSLQSISQPLVTKFDKLFVDKHFDIRAYLYSSITVETGGTLELSDNVPMVLVLYKLTIEQGARVLINKNSAVTIDCVHLNVH